MVKETIKSRQAPRSAATDAPDNPRLCRERSLGGTHNRRSYIISSIPSIDWGFYTRGFGAYKMKLVSRVARTHMFTQMKGITVLYKHGPQEST